MTKINTLLSELGSQFRESQRLMLPVYRRQLELSLIGAKSQNGFNKSFLRRWMLFFARQDCAKRRGAPVSLLTSLLLGFRLVNLDQAATLTEGGIEFGERLRHLCRFADPTGD